MSGWTLHDGKGVPADAKPTDRVEVVERDGDIDAGLVEDFAWVWIAGGACAWAGDIISYRLNPSTTAALEALKAIARNPERVREGVINEVVPYFPSDAKPDPVFR